METLTLRKARPRRKEGVWRSSFGTERTLLLLDGLEPLQHPRGPLEGRIKDPALAALLRELVAVNNGLVVITTRSEVDDLRDFSDSIAPRIDLEQLSKTAGAQLLKQLGATGTHSERMGVAEELHGHALSLTLLGTYLKERHGGDLRRRSEVKLSQIGGKPGEHAKKVLNSYVNWFGEKSPESSILHLMGLFDRPATGELIEVLRRPPELKGLWGIRVRFKRCWVFFTKKISLSEEEWQDALARLRRLKILAPVDPENPHTLDAHPLVREYFGARLRELSPATKREAHRRVYEHLKSAAKELPDTLAEMEPLCQACAHGCAAELYQETLEGIYIRRMSRGSEHYHIKKLGAFGSDLAALAGFFRVPFMEPVRELTEGARAFILNEAGFNLQAVGRLREAAEPLKVGLEMRLRQKMFKNAAIVAENLVDLHVTLGELEQAREYGEESLKHAERIDDVVERRDSRLYLANAFRQLGKISEAEKLYLEAEEIQKKWQPSFPFLYSIGGADYCALLSERGEFEAVLERATQTLEWAKEYLEALPIATDHLSLARAHLGLAEPGITKRGGVSEGAEKAAEHLAAAGREIEEAVDGLRHASRDDRLPGGLLGRAAYFRAAEEFEAAERDITEAASIARRSEMKLYSCDAELEWARLRLAEGDATKARAHLEKAKTIVEETGYRRREPEIRELEEKLG